MRDFHDKVCLKQTRIDFHDKVCLKQSRIDAFCHFSSFSRMLCDSTPHFVSPSLRCTLLQICYSARIQGFLGQIMTIAIMTLKLSINKHISLEQVSTNFSSRIPFIYSQAQLGVSWFRKIPKNLKNSLKSWMPLFFMKKIQN